MTAHHLPSPDRIIEAHRVPLSDHQADTILANPDIGWSPEALDEAWSSYHARQRRHPRDWADAHADYAMTGDPAYRAERIRHDREDVPDQTEGTGVMGYLIGSVLILAAILMGIPAVCMAWVLAGRMLT